MNGVMSEIRDTSLAPRDEQGGNCERDDARPANV